MSTAGERANDSRAVAEGNVLRFRRSAAALARDGDRQSALDAASAILSLATSGEERILRGLLRPDPTADAVAWTVACYQIGDLTPSVLRDFSDACTAVGTLLDCGEAHHVAAELVVSTSTGLTWTPLARIGVEITFRLFATEAGRIEGPEQSGGSSASQRAERAARRAWGDLLLRWQIEPDADLVSRAVVQSGPADLAARVDAQSGTADLAARVDAQSGTADLAARVEELEGRIVFLETRLRALEDLSHDGFPLRGGPDSSAAVAP